VRGDDHPVFGHRLHDAVRKALRGEPVSEPGAWTLADRQARAGVLLEALRRRHDAVLDDPDRRLDILELAAGLCTDHDEPVHWLRMALQQLPGMARTAQRLPPPDEHTWIGQLSRFYDGWRDRDIVARAAHLEALIGTPQPPDIARATRLFLAYTLRTVGRGDESLALLHALREHEPDSSLVRYQIGVTLSALCRYDDLERLLSQTPPSEPTAAQRLRSDLAFEHGDLEAAAAGPVARAAYLHAGGRHRVALENETSALWRSALAGRATVAGCEEVIAASDRFGMPRELRTAIAAKAICGLHDPVSVAAAIEECAAVARATSAATDWREWTVRVLHAIALDDRPSAVAVRDEWSAGPIECTPHTRLLDRLLGYAGCGRSFAPLSEESEARWRAVIAGLTGRGNGGA
jgi:hypothetical protein